MPNNRITELDEIDELGWMVEDAIIEAAIVNEVVYGFVFDLEVRGDWLN